MAAQKQDPYRNFQYTVVFDGDTDPVAGFSMIDGLEVETEVIEYREGGDRTTPRKIIGQTSYPNLTMERGKTKSTFLRDWKNDVFALNRDVAQRLQKDVVKNFTIRLHDRDFSIVRRWRVECGWPTVYKTEALEGDGSDVLIETIEIAHEGLYEITDADLP